MTWQTTWLIVIRARRYSNYLTRRPYLNQSIDNLLDTTVEKTLANRGEVFLTDKEKMPAETQLAAIMRF
jgi:hypothetical protein